MAFIKITTGERKGVRIEIDRDEVTIGRSPASLVHLDNPSVSGRHCVIRREGRRFTLTDLDSTNGTRLNGVRVRQHSLSAKDIITVGDIDLEFDGGDIDNHRDSDIPPTIVHRAPATDTQQIVDAAPAAPVFKKRKSSRGSWLALSIGTGILALAALGWFLFSLLKRV